MKARQLAQKIAESKLDGLIEELQQAIREQKASNEAKHQAFSMVLTELSQKAYNMSQRHQKLAPDAIEE